MDKILWKPDNNQQTHFNHFIDLVNSKYDLDLKHMTISITGL